VTQEQVVDPDDTISQDQQALDQDQGITTDGEAAVIPQSLLDRFEAQAREIAQVRSQNQGLQSKIDNGLNAIRRDTETWVKGQFDGFQNDAEEVAWLNSLDEEQRPVMEGLLKRMDQRIGSVQQPAAQPQIDQQQLVGQQQLIDQWTPVMNYVEMMGIQRTDSRINLGLLAGAQSQVDASKWPAFRDHLIDLRQQDRGGAPAAKTELAQVAQANNNQQQTANPPVEGGGQSTAGALRSIDDVRDAFIQGRFRTPEDPDGRTEYARRMAALGQPIQ
jgi:hypothetical protein